MKRDKNISKENKLFGTRAYLCGSMEYSDGRGWRSIVEKELRGRGIKFFNPYKKPFIDDIPEDETSRAEMLHWRENGQYDLLAQRMKKIRSDDLRCIDLSDWLIAVVKPSISSWGTGEEIPTAVREKKPLFLVIDDPLGIKSCPLWFFGVIPYKYIYGSLQEALNTIKAIDDGIIKLTSDRWHLLQEEYR